MDRRKRHLLLLGGLVAFVFVLGLVFLINGMETKQLDDQARGESEGQFIQLDDGVTHYFLEGPEDGPLVVFVHGFSVPSYVWEPTSRYLNQCGYQTLRYDLYGRGYSDRPDLAYSHLDFLRQLEGLLAGLGLEGPWVIAGLSMGGPIAADYAAQHPAEVSGLILVAPEVLQSTSSDIFPLNVPGIGEYLMAAVMEPYLLPRLQMNDFFAPDQFPEWEQRYKVQMQYEGTGRALLATIRELIELDPVQIYQAVQAAGTPVLLVWGQEDQTIGEEQIQLLRGILPEMEHVFVEKAGHLVHYERAEEVNPLLADFLGQISW